MFDFVVFSLVMFRVFVVVEANGYLFDGFLWLVEQVIEVCWLVEKMGVGLDVVIYLDVLWEELICCILLWVEIEGCIDDNFEIVANWL